ncbi:hypothetical protein VTL71DRAFT_5522 [Oculimacula yallundae]|uniref:Uncharacterized protein n=1 Tax=Oculimacula yallundae TaxID=86028 RepID=A0ABR4C213_9HELO
MQAAIFEESKMLDRPPLSPELEFQPKKLQKKVRFDSSAIDNEHKMGSRRGSIATATSSRSRAVPSSQSSSSRVVANTSTVIDSRSIKQSAINDRARHGRRQSVENEDQYYVQRSQASQFQTRIPGPVSQPRNRSGDLRAVKTANPTPSKRSANTAAKRDKLPRQQVPFYVPPRVPDAPSSPSRKPPPAPRPRRLPTPDLMELDEDMMFGAYYPNVHGAGFFSGGGQSTKMDAQLAAAKSHMDTRR